MWSRGSGRVRVAGAIAVVLAVMLGTVGCRQAEADVPPPAGATALTGDGAWEVRVDLALSEFRRSAQPRDRTVELFRLPADATWADVAAHYSQRLEPEWTRSDSIAEEGRNSLRRMWVGDGSSIAVIFIDDPVPEADQGFHVLAVLEPE